MEVHRGVRLQFEVPGEAVPKLRARTLHVRGRSMSFTPQKVIDYENRVRLAAHEAVKRFHAERLASGVMERVFPTEDAVRLTVTFYRLVPQSFSQARRALALQGLIHPTSRPDASNLVKSVEDGLNGIVVADDAQCVRTVSEKRYGEEAFALVEIETLPEPEVMRVVAVATKLARGKDEVKMRAAGAAHVLTKFKTVLDADDAKAASVACKSCKRSALVEASHALEVPTVSGKLVEEACAS